MSAKGFKVELGQFYNVHHQLEVGDPCRHGSIFGSNLGFGKAGSKPLELRPAPHDEQSAKWIGDLLLLVAHYHEHFCY